MATDTAHTTRTVSTRPTWTRSTTFGGSGKWYNGFAVDDLDAGHGHLTDPRVFTPRRAGPTSRGPGATDWVDPNKPVTGEGHRRRAAAAGNHLRTGRPLLLYMGAGRYEAAATSWTSPPTNPCPAPDPVPPAGS